MEDFLKSLKEIERQETETKNETETCENIYLHDSRILDCYNFSK